MTRKVWGHIVFFSERFGGRPFNNCLILAVMVVLRWMGYDMHDGDDDVIRAATGVADYDSKGKPVGLTFGQVMKALGTLFSGYVLPERINVSDEDLINNLKLVGQRGRNRYCFAVVVDTGKLPSRYQRWVGQGYDGLHGMSLVATTTHATDDLSLVQVFMLDPMQPATPPADFPATEDWDIGELIPWSLLSPALRRDKNGLIKVVRGQKNVAGTVAPVPA